MAPNRRLKQARELRGWSQARLAEMIGTDATTVSRWERGLFVPTPHFREKLCECFSKNAEELGLLDAPANDPHLHGVVGLPREPELHEGSGLSGPTRGEMVALKPRTIPEGVDTFTYILQRSSQEQQAYMLWEHAYVQALQDQPAEAQRLGQASVSVFEQVRHPNAAVVRAWLSQQGLLAAAASSPTDPSLASEIARKRSSRPWLRVGGASVFVVLVLVAGMMLSGITSNRNQSPAPSGIKYSPQVVGGDTPANTPTQQATATVAPAQSHAVSVVNTAHAPQTPSPVPTSMPSPTPISQTTSPSSVGSAPDPSVSLTISLSHLNPHTCFKDGDGYRCAINLAVYANTNEIFSWQASRTGIPTTFNSLSGTIKMGKSFQEIVYIHTSNCSQTGTLTFDFTTAASTHVNTISASWGCS